MMGSWLQRQGIAIFSVYHPFIKILSPVFDFRIHRKIKYWERAKQWQRTPLCYNIAQTLTPWRFWYSLWPSLRIMVSEMKSTTSQKVSCTQNKLSTMKLFSLCPLMCKVDKETIFLFYRRESWDQKQKQIKSCLSMMLELELKLTSSNLSPVFLIAQVAFYNEQEGNN